MLRLRSLPGGGVWLMLVACKGGAGAWGGVPRCCGVPVRVWVVVRLPAGVGRGVVCWACWLWFQPPRGSEGRGVEARMCLGMLFFRAGSRLVVGLSVTCPSCGGGGLSWYLWGWCCVTC